MFYHEKEAVNMIISNKQIEKLRTYIKNIDELIQKEDVQEILNSIDDIIVNNILGNNCEPNEEGIELQKIYDQIFNDN